MDPKQVLVICSDISGTDFNNLKNENLKVIFKDNPVYTYCNGLIKQNIFPLCPENDERIYDFIWFAGCNLISQILPKSNNGLVKIINILKLDGKVIFTEGEKYVEKYIPNHSKLSLTLQIEHLIEHTREKSDIKDVNIEELLCFFTQNFRIININNHIIYQRIVSGLKKYLKYKKKYLQLKNKNFNL
jgi:hypothetical protein